MTPEERRAALETIGWTERYLADQTGISHSTIQRWIRGSYPPPPEFDRWLGKAARWLDKNPPPEFEMIKTDRAPYFRLVLKERVE